MISQRSIKRFLALQWAIDDIEAYLRSVRFRDSDAVLARRMRKIHLSIDEAINLYN